MADTPQHTAEIAEADLTRWLREWVRVHGGTDLRDTTGRLVLACRCGKALGPSYGPTETGGRDAEERETVAYFQHQAADLLAAFTISTPPAPPIWNLCVCDETESCLVTCPIHPQASTPPGPVQ